MIPDPVGVEVIDAEQARTEALYVLEQMLEDGGAGEDWVGWRLEIADEAGTTLWSIELGGIGPQQ